MLENWDRITPSKSPGEDSFNTDFSDLATTVAASEITDTIEVGQLTPSTKAAVWKRQPAVRARRLADQPSDFVLLCNATLTAGRPQQKGGSNEPQRKGRAGTNGEGGWSEKRACRDTIEESSSVDEVDARRKRRRSCRKSHCSCLTHLQSDTSLHFHITALGAHGLCSNGTTGSLTADTL